MGNLILADEAPQTDPFWVYSKYIPDMVILDSLTQVILNPKKLLLWEIYPLMHMKSLDKSW